MNYSMGSGIIRYIRVSKTFSKFRAVRSSVRFEVPCVSKFRAFRSSVRFEVPCVSNCVEVFEKTISRTEMIDHSFERKFFGAWNRLCLKLVRGFNRARRARKVLILQICNDSMYQSL